MRARISRFYRRFRVILLFLLFLFASVLIAFITIVVYNAIQRPPSLTKSDVDTAIASALATATPPPSFESQVYKIISPSVVTVLAFRTKDDAEVEISRGTGIIIDEKGWVVTCYHIVKNAAKIQVTLADGTESGALTLLRRPENDIAVLGLTVRPDSMVPARLGDSNRLQAGDEVIAVGHPFGIGNSLSAGVISGTGRTYKLSETGEVISDLIQFDAAINPGNSGGPLVDRRGEVVGMVVGLLNPTGQDVFIGIGFAVPIEIAMAGVGPPWY